MTPMTSRAPHRLVDPSSRSRRFPLAGILFGAVALASTACGGGAATQPPPETPATTSDAPPAPEPPPGSGPPREVSFPPIARNALDNGLGIEVVPYDLIPAAYVWLTVKSGGETDPEELPGLAGLVADMLEEGTKSRTSAELADAVDFLGADLFTFADEENLYIGVRALSDQLEQALGILAEVARQPAFRNDELAKLKRRELDRLSLQLNDPRFLARRAMAKALYGDHPYARIDTTPEAVEGVTRRDLQRWHAAHVVPNNAFLTVAGDVDEATVGRLAESLFGDWRRRDVPETPFPEPPDRQDREIIVVDRPDSVQSVILIGNLAVPRAADGFEELLVANQVLGGSAASRLFMDLRERRSLTYGAYSYVSERVRTGPFQATASVRTEVTGEAMAAFFDHLDRIVAEPPGDDELAAAKRYLSDSFPLRIDSPGKVARLVVDQQVFGLPEGYWEGYRSAIAEVTASEALAAAQSHIHPDRCVVVVVGKAADIVPGLRDFGPVRVETAAGEPVADFDPGEG